MTMNAIQAARQGLLAPIQYLELDLSVARTQFSLGITANTFYIDPGADGSAYRGALVDLIIDKTPLTAGPGFLLRQQSADVAITNAAQPGKRLRLVYGQDVNITSWFNQSAVSLQSQQALVPESQNYFTQTITATFQTIVTLTGNAIVMLDGNLWSGYGENSINWSVLQPIGQVTGIGLPAYFGAQPQPSGTRRRIGTPRWTNRAWLDGTTWFTRTDFMVAIQNPFLIRGNFAIVTDPGSAGATTAQYFGHLNYSLIA